MKLLMFWFLVLGLSLHAENPFKPEDDVRDSVPLVIHNANTINVDAHRNPRDCTRCVGSEFKKCMRALTKEDFVMHIYALHPRACTAYIEQLQLNEIIEIRKLFTVEEWSALPEIFTQTMAERFKVEREKTIDAWWNNLLNLLVSINAIQK